MTLRTNTEAMMDARRIEALEGQLRDAYRRIEFGDKKQRELSRAYGDALEALAVARIWRIAALLALLAMALSILARIVT
jgi:hypothetical protein